MTLEWPNGRMAFVLKLHRVDQQRLLDHGPCLDGSDLFQVKLKSVKVFLKIYHIRVLSAAAVPLFSTVLNVSNLKCSKWERHRGDSKGIV